MTNHNDSIFSTARHNLEQAAQRVGLDDAILNKIAVPKEKNELRLNPVLEDGRVVNVVAFIVRHSDILGPAKGGIYEYSKEKKLTMREASMDIALSRAVEGITARGLLP